MNINIGPNTLRVYEYLKNKNLQPNVIKNIMGNLVKESNMKFDKSENLNYSTVKIAKDAGIKNINKLKNSEIKKLLNSPEDFANVAYANRMGNTEEGDGYKYRGRGYIQITGKDNYQMIADSLGMPEIVENPDLILDNPKIALNAMYAYIEKNNLDDPKLTTKQAIDKINPGLKQQDKNKRAKDIENAFSSKVLDEMESKVSSMDETERMLMDSTPTGEVDPGDEENPRTRRNLPPQAITPKEKNLTGVAPMPIKKEYDEDETPAVEMPTMKEEGEVKAVEMPTVDDQMDALDFGDLRDAPGSKRIRTAKEEKEQVEKMKKATKEGTRVAGEKSDTTTGFEGEEYIPSVEMESLDDTMIADDTQVSATDMDDTPSGDDIFTTFFKSLGDVTFDEGFEVDDLNLNKGGAVEADFDGKDKDDEDEDEGDPPPLAKPEEVADDIPAMLSEGEYVLPANVVRYLGLERIMDMHQKVLHEIQQMEDLGMIQNVDENGKPENDDDEMKFIQPEGEVTETLIIAAKPQGMMCPPKMSEGGQINRDIDIDRTLDDDMLNIRSSIATQRSPTVFKTVFDPEVGFLKIKTPKGSLTVDKGAIDDFINQNEGPEGADPADPDVGGTASSFDVIGQSLQDIYSFEVDRAKDLMSMEQEQADTEKGMAEVDTDLQDQEQQTSDPAETGPAEAGEDEAELRSGGLMARFNTGGAVDYNIAGVGTVAGDMQLGDQLAAMEKPKTYEEIRADVLGDPLRDTPDLPEDYGNMKSENYIYKDNPVLEGSKLQTRKKRSSYVYDPSAGGGEGSNAYRNDKEVRQLLDLAGVDSEEYAFVMDGYNKGDEYLGGAISIKQNERLKKGLDALADKRRILKQGLKASDIPEGATNRDVFKKVFFNEIDYFGESLDPENFEQPTQLNTVLNITDNELERLRSGKEAGTLDKKEREQIEFLDKFDLDAPAETDIVNQGISVLSGGRQGTTFYDSSKERAKRLRGPRSGIMGEGQYVEGVGYVT
tara:strand:- start:6491 stop:9484 length:2994 start_codon:yes stop_codon:yes gene_type:complete